MLGCSNAFFGVALASIALSVAASNVSSFPGGGPRHAGAFPRLRTPSPVFGRVGCRMETGGRAGA